MNTPNPLTNPGFDSVLAELIEAEEHAADQAVDISVWTSKYPQYAEQIRSFFVNRGKLEAVVGPRGAVDAEAPTIGVENPAGKTGVGQKVRYFGDYELLEEIARGGMGVVYKARQVSLNRVVALKMILAGQLAGQSDVRRFHAEAEAAANLDHPYIVPIYEVGEHEGQHYFSMKLIEGGNLSQAKENRPKTESAKQQQKWAATLVAQLARAVHHAHQRGILHRDLKPGNVLLDAEGEPHIPDFGLAKKVEGGSDLTNTGAIVGTPNYMAPEQARSEKGLSTAVDVYGLGAIFYELLTGRPPFQAATPLDTILKVLEKEPARPSSINQSVDRDLETITLKCLEKEPGKRYGSAEALEEELGRWLKGEPITARPAGLLERTKKWTMRNPGWASGIAVGVLLLIVATTVGLVLSGKVLEQQKATQAEGLVKVILNADTVKVPDIIDNMSMYRQWVDPLLRQANDKAADKSQQKLHTSLALLPVDSTQVKYLYDQLLEATPQAVPVIRDALAPHKGELLEQLWAVVDKPEKGKESQRLPAAVALAMYDPKSENWAKATDPVVHQLVGVNPVFLGLWMEGLRPIKGQLLASLASIYRNAKGRESERTLATSILADYAADNPQVLADLLMDADANQFALIYGPFKCHGEQSSPLLTAVVEMKLPANLPSSDGKRETLAKRQANAGAALLKMNQPERVWPLFKHSSDPRVRSYLIHLLSPLGVDAKIIAKHLEEEADQTISRALLLSLGEIGEKDLTHDERQVFLQKLKGIYRTANDSGLHAASEWLLRQWKEETWLKQVNDELAKDTEHRKKRLDSIGKSLAKDKEKAPPQWYVNGQGQTMVVIPGPVEFLMGSPVTEAERRENELQHKKRIPRSFALAATPVTKEQFLRFDPTFWHSDFGRYPNPSCPMGGVIWSEAAAYCNWLSKEEGLPEDQWCYEIAGDRTKLKANYLTLSGYRLPTEAEMEYATRANTVTARYFGETDDLLPKYAWYEKNSQQKTWPVGSLKPNDFGLFDVQGNVYTWCQESYKEYPKEKAGEAIEDREDELIIRSAPRVLRGGSFLLIASILRSASRNLLTPTNRINVIGCRVARTFAP